MTLRRLLLLLLVGSFVMALLAGCRVSASELPAKAAEDERPSDAQPVLDNPEPLIIEERLTPHGEEFEVHLQGNPTTGYAWQVAELDEQKVVKIAEEYVESRPGDQQIVGAGGAYIFRFRASAQGRTRIVMVYRRPWEKDVDPLRTYILDLTVR